MMTFKTIFAHHKHFFQFAHPCQRDKIGIGVPIHRNVHPDILKNIKKSSHKNHRTKFLSLFSLVLLLSGCGSYSGSFDCPIGEGLKCASLSEVNQKIDRGALNFGFPSEKVDCPSCQNGHKSPIYWRSDVDTPHRDGRKGRR